MSSPLSSFRWLMVERGGFEPPKAYAGRFTVCSLWPLGHLSPAWSRWPELNWQPTDYKSVALPLSYIGPTASHGTMHTTVTPPPGVKPASYHPPCPLSSSPRRSNSYMAIAPATETFSDSTTADWGLRRRDHSFFAPAVSGRFPLRAPAPGALECPFQTDSGPPAPRVQWPNTLDHAGHPVFGKCSSPGRPRCRSTAPAATFSARGSQTNGAVFGDHHGSHPDRGRGSDECSEIVGILDLIEHEEEPRTHHPRPGLSIAKWSGPGSNPLMRVRSVRRRNVLSSASRTTMLARSAARRMSTLRPEAFGRSLSSQTEPGSTSRRLKTALTPYTHRSAPGCRSPEAAFTSFARFHYHPRLR